MKEALHLQKENNFVIIDVRPEAEFKEEYYSCYLQLLYHNSDISALPKLQPIYIYL